MNVLKHCITYKYDKCNECLCILQVDKEQQSKDSVYFKDGVRRVDFVLSYVEDKDEKKPVSYETFIILYTVFDFMQTGFKLPCLDHTEMEIK